MIVIKKGKEPNSLLRFRKENPDADYESDIPTDVLKDIRKQMWEEQIQVSSELNIVGRDIREVNRNMIKRQLWILNGCLACAMEIVW